MIPAETIRFLPRARLLLVVTTLQVIGLMSGLPIHGAQAQQAPAAGMFLVASHDLRGSGFAESVILIIQHDADGTMGLIINQPTHTNPAELLSDIAGLENYTGKLFVGGPVAAWGVIMLLHSDQSPAPANAKHIFSNVYTSGDRELLSRLVRSDTIGEVRLYAGHAGWSPGQLDAEIKRGSWHVVPASTKLVFSTRPRELWQRLIDVSDRLIVNSTDEMPQKYTYNAMSPRIMPIRSGHFSSATP